MLTYLDLLQPGFSCRRGMILYELHTVLLIQGRSSLDGDKAGAREDLMSARENAKIKLQDIINTRKKLRNRNLFNLLGVPLDTKVSSILYETICLSSLRSWK